MQAEKKVGISALRAAAPSNAYSDLTFKDNGEVIAIKALKTESLP